MSDVLVHYVNKITNEKTTAKLLSQCSEQEKNKVNLRRLFSNEVVLDLEDKSQLDNCLQKLNEHNWSYRVWDTGSRGYHIHLLFEGLEKEHLEVRNRFRKFVISEFEADESVASESHAIAMEDKIHFKTQKSKTLFKESKTSTLNSIKPELLELLKQWHQQQNEGKQN